MTTTTLEVLCGQCKCAVETVANPDPDSKVSCPQCGRSDRYDAVMASVKSYIGELAAQHLSEMMRNTTRNNRFVKVTVNKRPERRFDWICTDLEL